MREFVVSDVNAQKQKILTEAKSLVQNPTVENMQAYQITIKDFVSSAVAQLYMTAIKSAWENKPQENFYLQINEVDNMLQKISQSIDEGNTENLINQCGQLNELLERLFWYN